MTTTIQVREETVNVLKKLKEQTGAKTYDEIILALTKPARMREAAAGYLSRHLSKKNYNWMQKNLRDKND